MEVQPTIQSVLNREFSEIKERNPSFSLRAFARRLNTHPATLSHIMNGKRRISEKVMLKLATSLALSPDETRKIIEFQIKDPQVKSLRGSQSSQWVKLTEDQNFLIADWCYYGLLSLIETKGFKSDLGWIADRLGVSKTKAKEVLERLERLNLILVDTDGQYGPQQDQQITTSYDVPNNFIKSRHKENLVAAEDALFNVDVLLREFSFTTMAIDPEKIPEAKLMVRNFRRKLCEFLETGEQSEVYELCVQMFPRTNNAS